MNTEQHLPPVPAEYQAELNRFREAAIHNVKFTLMGQQLRFRKRDWLYGPEKQKIPGGSRFVGIMNETRFGYIKWNADKTAVHVVGKIIDGFKLPPREALDCQDETKWPIGLDGKPQDPWRLVVYLPLASLDGEQLLTFSSNTKTGRPAFWKLVDRYSWQGRKHPGQYPIIELKATGYEDKRFGWIDTPSFPIVGWTDRPTALELADATDEEDDFGGGEQNDDPEDSFPV